VKTPDAYTETSVPPFAPAIDGSEALPTTGTYSKSHTPTVTRPSKTSASAPFPLSSAVELVHRMAVASMTCAATVVSHSRLSVNVQVYVWVRSKALPCNVTVAPPPMTGPREGIRASHVCTTKKRAQSSGSDALPCFENRVTRMSLLCRYMLCIPSTSAPGLAID